MYRDFIPMQLEVLPAYAQLIPGTLDVVKKLRASGTLIGTTTGTRSPLFRSIDSCMCSCLFLFSRVSLFHFFTVTPGVVAGYNREMNAINLAEAAKQGFVPDCSVSASDVPVGRPSPAMCLANAIQLKAPDMSLCVKVDDTLPGIAEGLNAGTLPAKGWWMVLVRR